MDKLNVLLGVAGTTTSVEAFLDAPRSLAVADEPDDRIPTVLTIELDDLRVNILAGGGVLVVGGGLEPDGRGQEMPGGKNADGIRASERHVLNSRAHCHPP